MHVSSFGKTLFHIHERRRAEPPQRRQPHPPQWNDREPLEMAMSIELLCKYFQTEMRLRALSLGVGGHFCG